MATLAQINETLRDQTSSIEDGTRTTAGLRDRFGEFLDKQQGSGDKREQEIEERQKERRQRVMASRPTSFTSGLKQGLGFGGLNFGGIAEKLLGAMGLAAGTIGLGAGKLLRFGPAIAVMSKFGEQAISGLVDYVDKEIDGLDFSAEAKETLTKGGQFALAARFAGIKSPLGLAMAGLVGAYGEETMRKVNEAFGNEDGVYTIPGTAIDIDTESQAFIGALGFAMAALAPALLKFAGKRLALALALLPVGKGVKALSAALGLAMGVKAVSGGAPPDPDEIKKNKKPTVKTVKPITAAKAMNFRSAIQTTTNIPKAANINAMSFSTAADPRVNMKAANLNNAPKVTTKSTIFKKYDDAIIRMAEASDGLKKAVGKTFLPAALVYEYMSGLKDPALADTPDFMKGTVNLLAETTGGTIDLLSNGVNAMINLASMGINRGLNQLGSDAQIPMLRMDSNLSGAIKRSVNSGFKNFQLPTLNDQGMIDNIGLFPPNVGLIPGGGAQIESVPGVQVFDGSNNVNNHAGNMSIISIGETQDFGSKIIKDGF